MLPDDTLLEIFDFYRMKAMKQTRAHGRSWKWHRLAHVCRRWRHVISTSPRRLGLQILCKSGASIERALDFWGTLPVVVRFNRRKIKSLPQNIRMALCRPDRVREIDLGLTRTAFISIVDAIKKPFQTLESIRITIKDATGPSLLFHNAFLGGSAPCLREIRLDGISFPFPELNRIISSTNNLVELRLSRIPKAGYFSAEALVTALSASTKLIHLQVSFHYPASLPTESTTTPLQRTTFPSLLFLEFHGASEYLEDFVSRVDFPSLRLMVMELFNQIFFEIPEICRSISLSSAFESPFEVQISLSTKLAAERVTVHFRHSEKRGIKPGQRCYLRTDCEQLDWKLSFVTQVLSQLSLLLKSVGTLQIYDHSDNVTPRQEDVDSAQWVEIFQPFTHVRELRVSGKVLQGIMRALVTEDVAAGVLPELTQLFLWRKFCTPAVVDAAEQFVAARKLSGRAIRLSIF